MRPLFALLAVVAVSLYAWGQTPAQKTKVSPLAEYSGEWTATFDGKVWLRLRLELRGDQLSGSLVHPHNLELNDNGELKSVSEEQSSGSVIAAVLNPDGLLLTIKDPDAQDNDRYMMRIVTPEKDTADLKMIAMSMPPGMAKPKPWRLVKSGLATNQVSVPR